MSDDIDKNVPVQRIQNINIDKKRHHYKAYKTLPLYQ